MSWDRGFLSCITRWMGDRWLCLLLWLHLWCSWICASGHTSRDALALCIWHRLHSEWIWYLGIWPWQIKAHFSLEALGGLINSFNQLRMQQLGSCRNQPSLPLKRPHSIYHNTSVLIPKRYGMSSFQGPGTMKVPYGSVVSFARILTSRLLLFQRRGIYVEIFCHGAVEMVKNRR